MIKIIVKISYVFFFLTGFKALEDGWCLFRPEEEYAKVSLKFSPLFLSLFSPYSLTHTLLTAHTFKRVFFTNV